MEVFFFIIQAVDFRQLPVASGIFMLGLDVVFVEEGFLKIYFHKFSGKKRPVWPVFLKTFFSAQRLYYLLKIMSKKFKKNIIGLSTFRSTDGR